MTVEVFCSLRGAGHVHVISRFDPAHHRVDVDGRRYWVSEDVSVSEAAADACAGKLKPVVKPVVRDERVAPGASSDAAPIAGGFEDGQVDEGQG